MISRVLSCLLVLSLAIASTFGEEQWSECVGSCKKSLTLWEPAIEGSFLVKVCIPGTRESNVNGEIEGLQMVFRDSAGHEETFTKGGFDDKDKRGAMCVGAATGACFSTFRYRLDGDKRLRTLRFDVLNGKTSLTLGGHNGWAVQGMPNPFKSSWGEETVVDAPAGNCISKAKLQGDKYMGWNFYRGYAIFGLSFAWEPVPTTTTTSTTTSSTTSTTISPTDSTDSSTTGSNPSTTSSSTANPVSTVGTTASTTIASTGSTGSTGSTSTTSSTTGATASSNVASTAVSTAASSTTASSAGTTSTTSSASSTSATSTTKATTTTSATSTTSTTALSGAAGAASVAGINTHESTSFVGIILLALAGIAIGLLIPACAFCIWRKRSLNKDNKNFSQPLMGDALAV